MKTKPNTDDRFVIIMAGGRGERFWPVSREKTPKQLIDRKSTRLNSSHGKLSRMPSSA